MRQVSLASDILDVQVGLFHWKATFMHLSFKVMWTKVMVKMCR